MIDILNKRRLGRKSEGAYALRAVPIAHNQAKNSHTFISPKGNNRRINTNGRPTSSINICHAFNLRKTSIGNQPQMLNKRDSIIGLVDYAAFFA